MPAADDMNNFLRSGRHGAPAKAGSPINDEVDRLWAEYQRLKPERKAKKPAAAAPRATQTAAPAAAPMGGGDGAPALTARPVAPPAAPMTAQPPSDMGDAEKRLLLMRGTVDPYVRANDPSMQALEKQLIDYIRAGRGR